MPIYFCRPALSEANVLLWSTLNGVNVSLQSLLKSILRDVTNALQSILACQLCIAYYPMACE